MWPKILVVTIRPALVSLLQPPKSTRKVATTVGVVGVVVPTLAFRFTFFAYWQGKADVFNMRLSLST